MTLKQPYGVVATIIPWNTPLLIAATALGPAVVAGNSIIVKPRNHPVWNLASLTSHRSSPVKKLPCLCFYWLD